ncbi:thiamine pyrophosphate-dependent enzyme [Samsonia erythrinae]|uniref:Thiamine pyrophosphate-dependent enzyme n=2 Tax=Samsonia erythrinae TaxID=160434 RepID=A0A4R3VLQ6_9GAMM|nr:thiamine pyrophosphate-dependent enzyme [Samsonia erythrinae]
MSLYNAIDSNDILLVIGATPDEYTTNHKPFNALETFFLTNIENAYGTIGDSFKHHAKGKYYHVYGPLDDLLRGLLSEAEKQHFLNQPCPPSPDNLNHREVLPPRAGYVDMAAFYLRLHEWWPENSVVFDDVCLAYKDRQYVTQRPNSHLRSYSLYRGSAMGGAFGAAVGTKIASPDSSVFIFTGDGCFRLFSGALGEARDFGIVIFLLNNAYFSIVGQGLPIIMPEVSEDRYHSRLTEIDYCGVARACGWDAEKVNDDLSNLDEILNKIGSRRSRSILVEIPVDPLQTLGLNPRAHNL